MILIEKEQHQALLDQLPEAQVGIDREAIVNNLVSRLINEEIVLEKGQTLEDIANELFEVAVLPVLAPRVEKFNDLMNKSVSEDSVSSGFIAFSGLAKQMALQRYSCPELRLLGIYTFAEGEFGQGGEWEWSDEDMISGTTKFNANLSADIDENIAFDLEPYGKDRRFSWNFSCSGDVAMEQTYAGKRLGPKTHAGTPTATLRVRPSAEVVASKTISPGAYFSVNGEGRANAEKTFLHPAILEVDITAKKFEAE